MRGLEPVLRPQTAEREGGAGAGALAGAQGEGWGGQVPCGVGLAGCCRGAVGKARQDTAPGINKYDRLGVTLS